MDVDDAAEKVGWNPDQCQEAAANDQINLGFAAKRENSIAEFLDGSKVFSDDDLARHPSVFCALNTATIGTAGDDEGDLCVERSRVDPRYQIRQRCPAAGDQYRQPERAIQWYGQRSNAVHNFLESIVQ